MVPLKTIVGLSDEEVKNSCRDKKIYIWGTGPVARDVYFSLKGININIEGFIDDRKELENQNLFNIKILLPQNILKKEKDFFIVIATAGLRKNLEDKLNKEGFIKGVNYINYFSVYRPVAVVDIAGKCNLHCICCPRGNMDNLLKEGYMEFNIYKKVLNKLIKDIPRLTKVQLFSWGEPFLNPFLKDIVFETEKIIPCTLSTNLMLVDELENVLHSLPSELFITVNGIEENYEKIMIGASWKKLITNLIKLSNLLIKLKYTNTVKVKLYLYKSDKKEKIEKFIDFLRENGLNFEICNSYLNPYDNLISYYNGEELSQEKKNIIENSIWDYKTAMEYSKLEIEKPCLSQRIFPIINWDLSVAQCDVYYYPIIAKNYLEISWEELLKKRHLEKQCSLCQKLSLHRFDIDVLKNNYKELNNNKGVYYVKSEFSVEKIREIIGDRDVYIYAANLDGVGYLRLFTKLGFNVKGFIDTREYENNMKKGKPVIKPDVFFNSELVENSFVLIATKHRQYKKIAMEQCEKVGLTKHKGYIHIMELCDYLPTIEVAGVCNLKCMSCSMGVAGEKQGKMMSADTYKKVLEKMTKEIPFMNSVYLYLWGEPLLNKDLSKIIEITHEFGIVCDISTNLNYSNNLEEVIKAGPDMLDISCSGVGKNYEMTHTKGKWDVLKENFYKVRDYIDKYKVDTSVRIFYHMYKHNLDEDYDEIEKIAKELGYYFYPLIAYIFPEKIYEYKVEGKELPDEMKKVNEMLIFPIEEQLKYAYEERALFCPFKKGIPTVRWDLSVPNCVNMREPVLAKNYLEISLKEIEKIRENTDKCKICMENGIHRFFDAAKVTVEKVNGKRKVKRELK